MSISESVLRGFPLFAEATSESLAALAAATRVTMHPSGDLVFRHGEPATALVLVRRGLVQVVRTDVETVTLGIFGPREPVGLPAVLDHAAYPADAVSASADVEVLRIPTTVLDAAMERDAPLVRAMNRALLAHTHALRAKIAVLTAGEVSSRLVTLLEHLAERFGDENERGEIFVPVALSRSDLARLVGARVETVTRVMSRWQKERSLTTTREGFVVHSREALR